jgi:site-specific DNA-methyltransferase (adenine-specific)
MKVTDKITITTQENMLLMARYPDNYFDLAIVDPPYGYGSKETNILNFRQKETHRSWNITPENEYFNELFRVSKNQIIWGGNYFSYIWGFGGRCFIYWHKGNPVNNFADGELAWTSFDKNSKQFDFKYYGNLQGKTSADNKIHPTQKPKELYKWLLQNYAKPGDLILDTHMGSQSSRIAAYDMGFDYVGFELDEDYFQQGNKRFENFISQQKLF